MPKSPQLTRANREKRDNRAAAAPTQTPAEFAAQQAAINTEATVDQKLEEKAREGDAAKASSILSHLQAPTPLKVEKPAMDALGYNQTKSRAQVSASITRREKLKARINKVGGDPKTMTRRELFAAELQRDAKEVALPPTATRQAVDDKMSEVRHSNRIEAANEAERQQQAALKRQAEAGLGNRIKTALRKFFS